MNFPLELYDQSWRRYHNRDHIWNVRAFVKTLRIVQGLEPCSPGALDLAVTLHDIIYVPAQAGCEEASALLAESYNCPLAGRLIRLTEKHNPAEDDPDGILLCNADLMGLATSVRQYDHNTLLIRQEIYMYQHGVLLSTGVPKGWNAGRSAWLESFLARPKIFHGPNMEFLEQRARENMTRELAGFRGA